MTQENIVDKYYAQLYDVKYPGTFLANMHAELSDTSATRDVIIMFNKFVKIYGRTRVFFAIIDVTGQLGVDFRKNLYGYYRAVLSNKFKREDGEGDASLDNLEDLIDSTEKTIQTVKKQKINIPELFNDRD